MIKKLAYAGIASAALASALAGSMPASASVLQMPPLPDPPIGIEGSIEHSHDSVGSIARARDGQCDPGEFCLYFNSNQQGAVSDFATSIPDYGSKQPSCYEFKGGTVATGQGTCTKNNAASVWNRTSQPVTVYYNSNYNGSRDSQTFEAGAVAQLKPGLKNENASHQIGGATLAPASTTLSFGLYRQSGGSISCGFDRYTTTAGRHEGIDFTRGIGSPVNALIEGRITNIDGGSRGRPGLSTIAVYNATYDKTVVYLHSAPLSGLSVGQTVSRGQQIATEDWRGVSYSSSAHTHVEMRLGLRTRAAKSVDDPTLDNPDPTSFWQARGYSIG